MDENSKSTELTKVMGNVELYPDFLKQEDVNIEKYTKVPMSKLSTIGTGFGGLAMAFQNAIAGSGGSGLYRVNTLRKTLVESRQGPGFIGALARGNNQVGGGMATMTPVICDPMTLLMVAALTSINAKLDRIMEVQKEIIAFLEQKEKAKLRGNLIFLGDVINGYKFNWDNEKYKNSNHIKVLDIKQEAEQSIILYKERIDRQVKKKSFISLDKDVKEKIITVQNDLREYQLSLYIYSFSSFLEVMLLENFESSYLSSIVHKIEEYTAQYQGLYMECYNQLESDSKSSLQANLLGGLASVNKAAGNAVAKIPVISKSQIDETLIDTGNRLGEFKSKRTQQAMQQFSSHQLDAVNVFVENINSIDKLYNQPVELLFDQDSIYLPVSSAMTA